MAPTSGLSLSHVDHCEEVPWRYHGSVGWILPPWKNRGIFHRLLRSRMGIRSDHLDLCRGKMWEITPMSIWYLYIYICMVIEVIYNHLLVELHLVWDHPFQICFGGSYIATTGRSIPTIRPIPLHGAANEPRLLVVQRISSSYVNPLWVLISKPSSGFGQTWSTIHQWDHATEKSPAKAPNNEPISTVSLQWHTQGKEQANFL